VHWGVLQRIEAVNVSVEIVQQHVCDELVLLDDSQVKGRVVVFVESCAVKNRRVDLQKHSYDSRLVLYDSDVKRVETLRVCKLNLCLLFMGQTWTQKFFYSGDPTPACCLDEVFVCLIFLRPELIPDISRGSHVAGKGLECSLGMLVKVGMTINGGYLVFPVVNVKLPVLLLVHTPQQVNCHQCLGDIVLLVIRPFITFFVEFHHIL
jgi:hypothetical protein